MKVKNQIQSTIPTGTAPLSVVSTTTVTNLSADLLDGVHGSVYYKDGDVVMPTNSFGGRKLYINSIDNAFFAADKKAYVTITTHLKTYLSESYPKLNPSYVSSYSVSGSGTSFTVTDSPSDIVVYNNDTLCTVSGSPTTQYQYTYSVGALTFGAAVTGTIYVYPGPSLTQYLDSPVQSTLNSALPFNANYEDYVSCASDSYIKIKISNSTDDTVSIANLVGGYPYGQYYASFYYTYTPEAMYYRTYNRNYRPHGIGWKFGTFSDFLNTNASSNYIATYSDDAANYGRSIIEFIVMGHSSHITGLSQLDWKLSRPNLSKSGSTVTKFGENKLYHTLSFGNVSTNTVTLDPNGTITGRTIVSNVATGTAPITVTSTTTVANLSADTVDGVTPTDSNFLVGNGTHWVGESGATARTSLGLGNSATLNTGTSAGTVALGDHTHTALYQPLNSTLNAVAAGTYSGDDSITTVGVVTAGTWNATTITVARGGTGSTSAAGARTNLETPKVFISATQPTATNIGDIWFIP